MKTITVASQALHDLATAGPSNHSFRGLPVPRPLPRAHGPHATLASVLPPTGQAGSCLKSLHSHSLRLSLAAVPLPPIFRAGFLPSLIQKSLVLSNIPSKHTASRHSPSSHLPFFPSWHLLPDTVTYLLVDLFECPSPPQYTSSSPVSASTAGPQPRQCSPCRRHKEGTLF